MSPRRALLLFLVASVCFGVMAFATKLAAARLSGSQVAAMRFVFMLAPIALLPRLRRRAMVFQRRDLLLYRGLFGGTAVLLFFLAIEHVPVSMATLLNYTSPIFSVLFAALFLDEAIDRRLVAPLAAALAGVVLVSHGHAAPGALFRFGRWEAVGLASAVLSGAAVAAIRAARRTEGSIAIYASFSVFGFAAAAPFAIATWHRPAGGEWILLAAVGLTSTAAQLLMTYSYRWLTNLQAGVLAPVAVLVATALGVAFLGEPFGAASVLGTALTIGGLIALVWLQRPPRAVE